MVVVVAAVALGGGLGACARYEASLALPSGPSGFPISTFAINVSKSLLLGALLAWVL